MKKVASTSFGDKKQEEQETDEANVELKGSLEKNDKFSFSKPHTLSGRLSSVVLCLLSFPP